MFEHRFAPGLPLVIGIERGELRFMLSEHTGDGFIGVCVYCFVADDVDALYRRCCQAGAHITRSPALRAVSGTTSRRRIR